MSHTPAPLVQGHLDDLEFGLHLRETPEGSEPRRHKSGKECGKDRGQQRLQVRVEWNRRGERLSL